MVLEPTRLADGVHHLLVNGMPVLLNSEELTHQAPGRILPRQPPPRTDRAMHFLMEQRRAWVRTQTHTLVFDRDPDFARFSQNPTGEIKQLYRIWLADTPANKRAYLGSIRHCKTGWAYQDLFHLFRRACRSAERVGIPPRTLRPRLAGFLRGLAQGPASQGLGSEPPTF